MKQKTATQSWFLTFLFSGEVHWRHLELWRLPRSWSQNPWASHYHCHHHPRHLGHLNNPSNILQPTPIMQMTAQKIFFRTFIFIFVSKSWHWPPVQRLKLIHSLSLFFCISAAPSNNDTGQPYKDWVFINYTFKRFEGLTQRGPPVKMAKEVVAPPKWKVCIFWLRWLKKFCQIWQSFLPPSADWIP